MEWPPLGLSLKYGGKISEKRDQRKKERKKSLITIMILLTGWLVGEKPQHCFAVQYFKRSVLSLLFIWFIFEASMK